jgi:hypothetical protein
MGHGVASPANVSGAARDPGAGAVLAPAALDLGLEPAAQLLRVEPGTARQPLDPAERVVAEKQTQDVAGFGTDRKPTKLSAKSSTCYANLEPCANC